VDLIDRFHMPSFVRTIWVSPEAKETYGHLLKRGANVFRRLEVASVVHGIRQVALIDITPEDLPHEAAKLAELNLTLVPVQQVDSGADFAHYSPPAKSGTWLYRCVVARNIENTVIFCKAKIEGDHATLGRLLGYPECCAQFFAEVWGNGIFDPIWQIATNSLETGLPNQDAAIRLIRVNDKNITNPLLRYVGIRTVPHIPHSFLCPASQEVAHQWTQLGRDEGEGEVINIIEDMLHWPMEWSVLHGIAEIRTPIFKVAIASLPTTEKWTVQLVGKQIAYPIRGITFPYSVVAD